MPNWVINRVTLKGNKEDIKNVLNLHIKNEDNKMIFDFNTVHKMPESLKIDKDTKAYDGLKLYIAFKNPLIVSLGEKKDKYATFKEFTDDLFYIFGKEIVDTYPNYILRNSEIASYKTKYGSELDSVINIGRNIYNNFLKHGFGDWYDWSIYHWGTKWNAHNTNVNDEENIIEFETAWTPSIPVIKKLAILHPEVEFIHEYSDENFATYTGKFVYEDGALVERFDYEPYSKDAYEISIRLWGASDQYRYNPEFDNYEYIEEEAEL